MKQLERTLDRDVRSRRCDLEVGEDELERAAATGSPGQAVRYRLAAALPAQRRPAARRRGADPRHVQRDGPAMRTITRTDERILTADIFARDAKVARADLGTHHEAARDIPVYRECDVLVVGGGPSGTAAAAAAARTGADVVLLERYNHLGGLSTGGLVIWIDRMTDWTGQLVIRGFAEELFERLPPDAVAGPDRGDWGSTDAAKAAHWSHRTAAYHGIVTWSPTIDPERLKLASQEMVLESGVQLRATTPGPHADDGGRRDRAA